MSNLAVESLVEKWQLVCAERDKATAQFESEINELEQAIKTLTGENPKAYGLTERYDDDKPHYIKNTEDGI